MENENVHTNVTRKCCHPCYMYWQWIFQYNWQFVLFYYLISYLFYLTLMGFFCSIREWDSEKTTGHAELNVKKFCRMFLGIIFIFYRNIIIYYTVNINLFRFLSLCFCNIIRNKFYTKFNNPNKYIKLKKRVVIISLQNMWGINWNLEVNWGKNNIFCEARQ